jgi:hypothetical protein
MTTEAETTTTPESNATTPIAGATTAPAASELPAKPAATIPVGDKEPAWLPGRLDQAKRSARAEILSELGIDDPKAGKEAIAAYRAEQEAKKSELQRAVERAAALESAAKERDTYRARVEAMTSQTLATLTPEQRNVVERLSGGDPLKMADTIDMLRPTWAQSSTPIAPITPAAPLPPAPATLAPAGAPPKPTAAKTKYDEWQDLEQSGKRNAAAMFYAANAAQIEQHRPA